LRPLRVLGDCFPDEPALDAGVSRAVMHRVARGELPETLRLARPAAVVAFAKRDALSPGYERALAAARARGFGSILRLAGGRAAVFHEGTLELAHAVPDPDPKPGIHDRFEATATLIARALRRLGVDARVGEVPGEYCPGRWSVNAAGERKLAGTGQRVVAGASHTGAVIVVDGAERVRDALEPVYEALELQWSPYTVGSVEEEVGPEEDLWESVRDALLAEYSERYRLMPGELDPETLGLAHRLAAEHRPPVQAARAVVARAAVSATASTSRGQTSRGRS
jgi:octanoyl-[GcvH]:protein N-octanoyltransferase